MGLFNFGGRKELEEEIKRMLEIADKQMKTGDYFSASFSYQEIAKLAEEKGDNDTAIKYLEIAAQYSLNDSRFYTAGWHYRELANLHFKKKEYAKTIENAKKAAELLIKANSVYAAQWAYNLASKAAEASGDVYTALRYCKLSLTLGEDAEIKEEMEKLKKKAPRPLVLEIVDKKEAKEGDEIEFRVIVENNSMESIKKVKLLDKYNKLISEVDDLGPHEEKYFSFKSTARVGRAKPAYNKISWENIIGDSFEEQIESVEVNVAPNVEIIVSSNPPLRLNKESNFIILTRNKSSSPIKNVKVFAVFPDSLVANNLTKTVFERIGPEEEKGAVFSITPTVVGESKVTRIKVAYEDEYGLSHENIAEPFILKESIGQENGKKTIVQMAHSLGKTGIEYLKNIEGRRREIQLNPHPLSQEEYVRLTASYFSSERGYTLRGVTAESLSVHVMEACDCMALISSHNFDREKLFLFSGSNIDTVYLLTVAIKEADEGLVNALFKAYSNKKDNIEKFISNMADIVEYTSMVMSSAKEVEKIEVNQVIKIIDSIVQRSQIGPVSAKNKELTIKDSVVQRSG